VDDPLIVDYLGWLAKYGKSYSSDEFSDRFQKFKQNAIMVAEHDPEEAGFDIELNMFADMTEDEIIAGHTGLFVPPEKTAAMEGFSFS